MGFNATRGFVGGAATRTAQPTSLRGVSMPHAALWVVQPHFAEWSEHYVSVSMPHAALWVVQQQESPTCCLRYQTFQCRTRLCGWCSLVALSSFPPRGKKPFWKVSGNLRCLTENI